MKRHLLAIGLFSSFALAAVAVAAPELKPAQEEAQASFEKEVEEPLKRMNDKCGTKVTVKTDFENFKTETWGRTDPGSYCALALRGVDVMCERPAYKKQIVKKITTVSCLLAGAKPKAAKDGTNEETLRNMTLEKSSFVYRMGFDHTNVTDNTKTTLEKALN